MPLDPNLEELALPLGHVVIEFNYLEIDVAQLISRLARADDLFGATLASIGLNAKVQIARKLATQRLDQQPVHEKLNRLLRRVDDLNAQRNSFIHGEYLPVVDHNEQYMRMAHRPVKNPLAPFKDVSPAKLEKLADDVRDLANELREFSATVYDLSPE